MCKGRGQVFRGSHVVKASLEKRSRTRDWKGRLWQECRGPGVLSQGIWVFCSIGKQCRFYKKENGNAWLETARSFTPALLGL